MDIVLLPSHIIQRIFDFLEPQVVYQCRYVCKTFHHEASRWLARCPPIDAFQSVVRLIETNRGSIFERKTPQNERIEEEVIMKNEEMNQVPRESESLPEPLGWWYLKRGNNFRHFPRPEVDKAVKNFLQEGMDCLPSFSFIHANFQLDDLIRSNSFRCPTIALIQRSSAHFRLDDGIFRTPLHTLLDIPEDIHLSEHLESYVEPYIDAIHINRFASDHKVILTSWFNPESIRPNLDDPEYPVKAFMYFTGWLDYIHAEDYEEIDQFLEGCNFPVMSCLDICSLFCDNPSKYASLTEPPLFSVAFAGKQIKSAMHFFQKFADELEFSQQVLEFKSSLDFQTDDGRVLGFIAHVAEPVYHPIGKYANRLIKIFESVKFVNIQMRNVFEDKFGSNNPAILLIRI
ncbi:uncharacterized protein LOC141855278 [Brevipalpus obovatus]|uniref:uncharacterized protein LOC141855278 n=1 Tax=Brevipalpus obovatus TaxID=246614 RepID=UPI003D9F6B02